MRDFLTRRPVEWNPQEIPYLKISCANPDRRERVSPIKEDRKKTVRPSWFQPPRASALSIVYCRQIKTASSESEDAVSAFADGRMALIDIH